MFVSPRYLQIITVATISVFSYACGEKKDTPKAPAAAPPAVVDVMIATTQTISDTVEVNGTILANDYVQLRPEVSGRLTFLDVPEGKFITKGTVIARINAADLEAQVDKSKVLLDLAEKTAERYNKLLAVNGINQSDYDAALNTVNGYKADIKYTQALIDKTFIRAPFNGVAGLRQVSPGAIVSPSDIIATMQTVDKLKIDFTLPEEYSNLVKKGNLVTIVSDAGNAAKDVAEIIAIEPQINQATRNLKVRAILRGTKISPGAFVKVYVMESTTDKAIMVPTNALIQEDINNQLVLVKNGKANIVKVKTGLRLAGNVEITSGVAVGDSIVVTGVLFARPKAALKVRKVITPGKTSN